MEFCDSFKSLKQAELQKPTNHRLACARSHQIKHCAPEISFSDRTQFNVKNSDDLIMIIEKSILMWKKRTE